MAGDGRARQSRIDLSMIQGPANEPVTYGVLRDFAKEIDRWAGRLQFGWVGFKVNAGTTGYGPDLTVGNGNVYEFGVVERDSSKYTKMDPNNRLAYFEVPPSDGGNFNVAWNFEFYHIETITDVFTFAAAEQTLVVPAGVTSMTVDAYGGSGRSSAATSATGGRGARVQATIPVTPGQTLAIKVGECPVLASGAGGYPNGGNPGTNANNGGGGGGRSQVKVQGDPDSSALVVAAGGGGGCFATGGAGGDGGYTDGLAGTQGATLAGLGWTAPQGGTQSAGGAPSRDTVPSDRATAGTAFQGGNASAGAPVGPCGGGGGDGWYGGGGGFSGGSGSACAAGGGGSSHTRGDVTGVTHTTGATAVDTDGTVSLSYTVENPVAAGVLNVYVMVARRTYLGYAPYEYVEKISQDQGYNPLHGSVNVPLGEGDRVYLVYDRTTTVDPINVKLATTHLSAIRNGIS